MIVISWMGRPLAKKIVHTTILLAKDPDHLVRPAQSEKPAHHYIYWWATNQPGCGWYEQKVSKSTMIEEDACRQPV